MDGLISLSLRIGVMTFMLSSLALGGQSAQYFSDFKWFELEGVFPIDSNEYGYNNHGFYEKNINDSTKEIRVKIRGAEIVKKLSLIDHCWKSVKHGRVDYDSLRIEEYFYADRWIVEAYRLNNGRKELFQVELITHNKKKVFNMIPSHKQHQVNTLSLSNIEQVLQENYILTSLKDLEVIYNSDTPMIMETSYTYSHESGLISAGKTAEHEILGKLPLKYALFFAFSSFNEVR